MDRNLKLFMNSSKYKKPSEIKKLRYIYNEICHYSQKNKIEIKNLRILEIGCGRGNITLPLASLGCQVRCFDINEDAIEYLKHEAMIIGFKNLIATVDDAHNFDDSNRYHIVIASEILMYFSNVEIKKITENIRNHLMPDSCLIVTIPNGYGPWVLSNRLLWNHFTQSNIIRTLFGRQKFAPYPYYYYTRNKLINIINMPVTNFAKSNSVLAMLWPIDRRENYPIDDIDIILADILPFWLSSGWYFSFKYSIKYKERS